MSYYARIVGPGVHLRDAQDSVAGGNLAPPGITSTVGPEP